MKPLKSGQIIDANFVTVPIQRNNRANNALIHLKISNVNRVGAPKALNAA